MKKLTLLFLILSLNLKSQSLFLEPKNFGNFIFDLKLKYPKTEILIDSISNNSIYFNLKNKNFKIEDFIEIGKLLQKSKEQEYQPFIKQPFQNNLLLTLLFNKKHFILIDKVFFFVFM